MEKDGINGQKGDPALQFTEGIDQLCDLIISRLEERQNRGYAFQAGCRGFEPRLPLHRYKILSQPASSGAASTVFMSRPGIYSRLSPVSSWWKCFATTKTPGAAVTVVELRKLTQIWPYGQQEKDYERQVSLGHRRLCLAARHARKFSAKQLITV